MALLNSDGSCYRSQGSIQQFDPENKELGLFNLWDEEIIKQGGSPIMYYEVFIQNSTIDPIYFEDRGKIFSNNPVQLYGTYEPIPSQNYINAFGIDSPDEMLFTFNYRSVLKAIGHPPKIGSRMFTPHLQENWEVVQRNLGEFKLWGALELQILAKRFQESVTTGEGKVTSQKPGFKII